MEDLKKEWQKVLIDVGKSEAEMARELGVNQVNLNRKIRTGTIKATEFDAILKTVGRELVIIQRP